MKTYTKSIQKPRLKIEYDSNPISPREDSNIGYFIACDSKMRSPDKNADLEDIIQTTGDDAKDVEGHMILIKTRVKELLDEKVIAIYPVTKYEHGSVSYSLGTAHGFDNSNNAFYIVTDKTLKDCGMLQKETGEGEIKNIIKAEIDLYNTYISGEIYCYELYDESGELEDTGGGFYSLEGIKDNLPKEWKDEDLSEYLTHN